jgi:hypothetical protein
VGVGQVMETQKILELPLNGRNVTDLITLGGGAVNVPEYVSQSRSMRGQAAIAVAGGLPSGVNYTLDGGQHTNPYDHLSLPLPFPDALQEFKVETSALAASQGQHSGAQVSSVTKSGTNEFHGDLFEFIRNDLLNATTYFAKVDPNTGHKVHSTLKRNQFGGTVGGPIVKNRLFFFGGYQKTINHQDPSNAQAFIPTPAMLRGDFTTIASGLCNNGRQITLLGFNNNTIDPSILDPVALNIAKKLPVTNDPCGLVTYGLPANTSDKQFVGKTDYQLNAAHSLMGRVLFTGQNQPVPFALAPDNLLTTSTSGYNTSAQSYSVGDTWLVSPQTVVSTRLVANYTNVQRLEADLGSFSDYGVKNYYSYLPKFLIMSVAPNGFALGSGVAGNATYRTFSGGLNSDASLTRGAHQISVGGSTLYIDSNSNAHVTSPGSFTFGSSFTGLALADFMVGKPSNFAQSGPNVDYQRKWYLALYLTDSWKVNQRWTLNYGLRWEPDLAENLTTGYVTKYNPQNPQFQSTVFTKAPRGFSFPGDPGFQGKRGRDRNMWVFGPRVGFAWDVRGDGKTSVRASTGLAYDYPNAQYHLWTSIVPPFGSSTGILNPVFDDPWSTPSAGFNGVNPFPLHFGPNTPFVLGGNFTSMNNIKPAQAQSWNLSVQRQIGNDWLVSASYVGSHIIHMLGSEQLNPAIYFPGNADASGTCSAQGYTFRPSTGPNSVCSTTTNTNNRRVLSLVDPINTGNYVANLVQIQSGGKSSYNGMLLEVRKRAGKGVTLAGNYTWAHCLAPFQSNEAGDTGANPGIPNPYLGNRDAGRGNCLSDRRQLFNFTPVLEMPNFQQPMLRKVASGWRLSTIYTYRTGEFINITDTGGNDFARNGTNTGNQLANYVGGNRINDNYRSIACGSGCAGVWFNKNAYGTPALGTLGNSGTRSIAAPSHFDFNMALVRSFRLTERQRFEFRYEVYNVTNSFRPGAGGANALPSGELTSPTFGQIRSSDDPRIMQFALKYLF